jgi:hypothetical protein
MLLSSTQTLELVLAQAITTSQLTYITNYVDEILSSIELGALGTKDGTSNDTTAVTITSSPTSGSVRKISGISIYNGDTVAAVITLRINDASVLKTLINILLIDGETLLYSDLRGFIILNANGELRVAISNLPSGSGGSSSTVPLHAITHESGGIDEIPLDRLGAPSDVTTLNATTSAHGLLKKLSNVATQFLNGVGNWVGIASTDLSDSSNLARLNTTNAFTAVGDPSLSSTASAAAAHQSLRINNSNTTGYSTLWLGGSNDGILKAGSTAGAFTGKLALITSTGDIVLVPGGSTIALQCVGDVVSFAKTQNFSWNSKVINTVYQAISDGFVVGIADASAGGARVGDILGYTDASNPPTTGRGGNEASSSGPTIATFMMPVRKGDYYSATGIDQIGICTYTMYWIPMGLTG